MSTETPSVNESDATTRRIDDDRLIADGGQPEADHGSPSDAVHERVERLRRDRERLADRIETVAGERPVDVSDGPRRVTARFERVDGGMMAALDDAFGVRTVGHARREEIHGSARTVQRLDVVHLREVGDGR